MTDMNETSHKVLIMILSLFMLVLTSCYTLLDST